MQVHGMINNEDLSSDCVAFCTECEEFKSIEEIAALQGSLSLAEDSSNIFSKYGLRTILGRLIKARTTRIDCLRFKFFHKQQVGY